MKKWHENNGQHMHMSERKKKESKMGECVIWIELNLPTDVKNAVKWMENVIRMMDNT